MNTDTETKEEKIPVKTWATWALLCAAYKGDAVAMQLCVDRLQQLTGDLHGSDFPGVTPPDIGPRSFVITTNSGHWGRGKNLYDAAMNCVKAGASRVDRAAVMLVLNDDTPEVNNWGSVVTEGIATCLNIGVVGTVGGILNTNKPVDNKR